MSDYINKLLVGVVIFKGIQFIGVGIASSYRALWIGRHAFRWDPRIVVDLYSSIVTIDCFELVVSAWRIVVYPCDIYDSVLICSSASVEILPFTLNKLVVVWIWLMGLEHRLYSVVWGEIGTLDWLLTVHLSLDKTKVAVSIPIRRLNPIPLIIHGLILNISFF